MLCGDWYESIPFKNPVIKGKCEFTPDMAEITLNPEHYSMYNICSEIENVNISDKICVDIDICGDVELCKFFAQWYADGVEIFKEYISKQTTLTIPDGADKLILAVLVTGTNGGKVVIKKPVVEPIEEPFTRKAVVAGLSIPYGFVWEHEIRKCEDNLRDSLNRIDALCKSDSPDLIVLTENFYNRITREKYEETFLTVDSPQIKKMCDKAKEHKVYISFSFREKAANGFYYNSALLIDRNGEIVLNYHKTHLTMQEIIYGLVPGDEIGVYDCDFGRVGIAICWDLYHAEFIRTLAKKYGVEIIINPSAGYEKNMHKQRAKDNGVFIVTGGVFGKNTSVISPEGIILADGTWTGAAVAEIDLSERFLERYLSADSYGERRNVYFNECREDLYN